MAISWEKTRQVTRLGSESQAALLNYLLNRLGPRGTLLEAMQLIATEGEKTTEGPHHGDDPIMRCVVALRAMRAECRKKGVGFGADCSGLDTWPEFSAAKEALPRGSRDWDIVTWVLDQESKYAWRVANGKR